MPLFADVTTIRYGLTHSGTCSIFHIAYANTKQFTSSVNNELATVIDVISSIWQPVSIFLKSVTAKDKIGK